MNDDKCVLMITLSVAEQLITDHWGEHDHPELALGVVKLNRESAERVHAVMTCDPAAVNEHGQRVCSLSNVIGDASMLAFQTVHPAVFALDLAVVATGKAADAQTGQML